MPLICKLKKNQTISVTEKNRGIGKWKAKESGETKAFDIVFIV